jgi:exodeoxyribonuclease-3
VPLKLATWNINSVRLRLPLVARFIDECHPDIICLQETKCRDAEFPASDIRKLGYEHIAINGQKGYHGVAILSRIPFAAVDRREFCAKGDSRHISVTFDLGDAAKAFDLHNFYVPAGGDEPDPEINPKFAHKLAFLDEMAEWMSGTGLAAQRAVLVGDLNIAPLETDVWNHKALLSVVSHTPIEVEKLGQVQQAGPWIDAMRARVPAAEKLYTWWSYRSPDWAAANKGRRLDHIWLSQGMGPALGTLDVFRAARGWERPSDHVPVMVGLDL